ncbi:MAG: peptidylprolyl isomerase [Planctomycetota bacterium]
MFERLEPRLMLAAAPVFETDLAEYYALNGDGKGLTIGIDGSDADGDPLTIDVTAGDPTGLRWEIFDQSTSANRYAVMHYAQDDGTPLGEIVVQLFEDRAPLAAERFITLATHDVDDEGNLIPAGGGVDPWYTDVDVHRVIDAFMFQSGDVVNGDGSGGTPLDEFPTETHPDLSFMGRGLLATANRGGDTNDGQWFITNGITTWLDGDHTIFGQVIAGWDVYETIITSETDDNDRPLDPPILTGADIVDGPADGTITLVADETFTGPVDLTITLSDTEGNDVAQVITVMPEPVLAEIDAAHAVPGETATVPLDVTFADGTMPLTFETIDSYDGPGEIGLNVEAGGDPGQYVLQVSVPAEYDNRSFGAGVYAYMDQFDNLLYPDYRLVEPLPSNAVAYLHGLPAVAAIGDVAVNPGDPVETTFTIDYAGEAELDVTLATAGYPGGELDLAGALTEPAEAGAPYAIAFDVPADWDGTPFAVEVSVELVGYAYAPSTGSFEVAMVTPTFDLPDALTVVPNEPVTLTVPVSYDGPAEFTTVASSDYNNGGTLTPVLTPPAQAGDPYTLAFDVPAEYDGGAFTITLTTTLDGYGAEPATQTLDVTGNAPPQIAPWDDAQYVPSGRTEEIQATITDADGQDLTVWVAADHAEAEVSIDPDTHVITVTSPEGFIGTFDVTVTAIETHYDGKGLVDPTEETFTVITNLRPEIDTDPLIVGHQGATKVVTLTATDEDDPDADILFDVVGLPVGWTGAVNAQDELSITPPVDFAGVQAFTVTAVEAAYQGMDDIVPTEKTLYLSTLDGPRFGEMDLDERDETYPGDVVSIAIPITYAGDPALVVDAESDYDRGGALDLAGAVTPPAAPGDPYTLEFTPPGEYDGGAFGVTVTAAVDGYDEIIDPVSVTFTFSAGDRPTLEAPDVASVIAGRTTEIRIPVGDADDDDGTLGPFVFDKVSVDDPDTTGATVTVEPYDPDDPETMLVTVTPPSGASGSLTVTVSALEEDLAAQYSQLATTLTFTVTVVNEDAVPVISDIDELDLSAGQFEEVTFTVDYSGDGDLTLDATHDYRPGEDGDDVEFGEMVYDDQDGTWTFRVTVPTDYNGSTFTVTVTPSIDGTPITAAAQTFEVGFGRRPEVTHIDGIVVPDLDEEFLTFDAAAGRTVTLPLTIVDETPLANLEARVFVYNGLVTGSVELNTETETPFYEVTLDIPEEVSGRFGVGVSVIESRYVNRDDLVWGGAGFWVRTVSVPSIEDVAVLPGATVEVPFQVDYEGDGQLDVQASAAYDGPGDVTVTPPVEDEDSGEYTLTVTVPAEYDGRAFDVTVSATVQGATLNGAPLAPAAATFSVWPGLGPRIVDPGLQVMDGLTKDIPLMVADAETDVLTVDVDTSDLPAGVTAVIDPAPAGEASTHVVTVTVPAGYEGAFDVTVSAIETAYAGTLDPTELTIPVATGLVLVSHLPDTIGLPDDGRGMTFPLDGWAPGDVPITYSVQSDSRQVSAYLPPANTNRYAELTFADENGQIGTILVELFDDRYADLPDDVESPVDRFVTLATRGVRQTGYDMDAAKPLYDLLDGDPFYTDVDVHRIIPGFMFQTGDAREGDGSGGTGMGPIEDHFGPDPYRPGNLSFAGAGVLAFANRGPGTSDGQFFITEGSRPHLDGVYPIFGQFISGADALDAIMYRPTDDNDVPEALPRLTGVTILEPGQNTQDTTLTLAAGRRFRGTTTVTVTMSADGFEDVEKVITVKSPNQAETPPSFGAAHDIAPAAGRTVLVPLQVSSGANYSETFTATTDYRGGGTVTARVVASSSDGYRVKVDLPDGYNGTDFTVTVVARKISSITGAPITSAEPSTATVEIHAAAGTAYVFPDNGTDGPEISLLDDMAIDGRPGGTYTRSFALDAEDLREVQVFAYSDYVGPGVINTDLRWQDEHVVLTVALPGDYDGSAFNVYLYGDTVDATGVRPTQQVVPVGFAGRPTIEDPGLISVPPGGDARVPLEITSEGDDDLTVEVDTLGDPNVTAAIVETFDPDTGEAGYALDVQMAPGYEGIVKLIVTAVETDLAAEYTDLEPFERVVYVSTLRERPEIDADEDSFRPLDGAEGTVTLSITDDSSLDTVYAITSSTPRVVAEWVAPPAGPQALGDAGAQEFHITAPDGYFGVFTVTVTAVEDHPFSDDALAPTTYVLTMTVPDDGGAPTIVSQSRLAFDDEDARAGAVVFDGDRMYVGASVERTAQGRTRSSDLYIYDTSGPGDPVLVDTYEGFDGAVAGIEVVHRLIEGQARTIILLAADTGGLHSILIGDDGLIEDADSVSMVARDVAVKDNVAYVAAGSGGLVTYDFTDPTALVKLDTFGAFVPTLKTQRKYQNFRQHPALWTYYFSDAVAVEIRGNYAFVAERHGRLVTGYNYLGQLVPKHPATEGWIGVINIADPAALRRGTMIMTRSELTDLDLEGTRLFAASTEGLAVYSVGNALAPRPLGGFRTDEAVASVEVANTTAFATVEGGYRRIDVSNPRRATDGPIFWVDVPSWSNEQHPDASTWLNTTGAVPDGTDIHLPISGQGVLGFDGNQIDQDNVDDERVARVWVNNLPVTLRLRGPGSFDVNFNGFEPVIDSIVVNGTDATSRLVIGAPPRHTTIVRDIVVNGPLNVLVGRTMTLTGDLTIDGSIRTLVLGDVGEEGRRVEQDLTLGAGHWPDARIVLGEVHNASLHSDTPIRSLVATRWMDDEAAGLDSNGQAVADGTDVISAPSIGRLVIRGHGRAVAGDLQADLELDNDGVFQAGTTVLGPTVIRGDVDESRWQLNGDVWRIFVGGALRDARVLAAGNVGPAILGGMIRSDLYAGYQPAMDDPDAVTGLPGAQVVADHFDALGSIGALIVRGLRDGREIRDSIVDSNVAAGEIGNVVARFGALDNDGDPFGLAAHVVRRLVYRDETTRGRWVGEDYPAETDSPRQLGDLIVRIV